MNKKSLFQLAAMLAMAMNGTFLVGPSEYEQATKPEKDSNDPAQAEKISKAEAKRQRRAAKRRSE